jgi:LmbE family N-acetylglucosaminyl deacetylase
MMNLRSTRLTYFAAGMAVAFGLMFVAGRPAAPPAAAAAARPAEAPAEPDAGLAPAVPPVIPAPVAQAPADGKLRIICFGAHPDDCELKAGGVGAKWAALGHHVKFVSVTNGDIGHWREAGGPLAKRRLAEVMQTGKILGITSQVLDIHDGELVPSLENRKIITRLIREWNADVVMCHRPNDYHPDHRYVGVLVQDAAYMVTVPFICPDTPTLTKNPLFLYYEDRFTRPNPFTADIVVDISDVIGRKLDAVDALESQFFEGGANGHAGLLPKDEAGRKARLQLVRDGFSARFAATANRFRKQLADWYGVRDVKFAEAFEIAEYGGRPNRAEIMRLFPFYGK